MIDKSTLLNIETPNNMCPFCQKSLLLIRSQNHKICVDCGRKFLWELKPNQLPLILHQR